ncbi:hypothetical protein [Pseudonocardia spinosispora]|uniref:hypothetical protein n=1 Tax=Pseudonocardia spinosispora TaxID=103441 RepID=UPI0012EBFBD8|nr:hypothetical protein [Pseudonocardia spinosispora]
MPTGSGRVEDGRAGMAAGRGPEGRCSGLTGNEAAGGLPFARPAGPPLTTCLGVPARPPTDRAGPSTALARTGTGGRSRLAPSRERVMPPSARSRIGAIAPICVGASSAPNADAAAETDAAEATTPGLPIGGNAAIWVGASSASGSATGSWATGSSVTAGIAPTWVASSVTAGIAPT